MQAATLTAHVTCYVLQLTKILTVVRSMTRLFVFPLVQEVMPTLTGHLLHIVII